MTPVLLDYFYSLHFLASSQTWIIILDPSLTIVDPPHVLWREGERERERERESRFCLVGMHIYHNIVLNTSIAKIFTINFCALSMKIECGHSIKFTAGVGILTQLTLGHFSHHHC